MASTAAGLTWKPECREVTAVSWTCESRRSSSHLSAGAYAVRDAPGLRRTRSVRPASDVVRAQRTPVQSPPAVRYLCRQCDASVERRW